MVAKRRAELLKNYNDTEMWKRVKNVGLKETDVFKPKRFLSPEETRLAKLMDELDKKGGIKHNKSANNVNNQRYIFVS